MREMRAVQYDAYGPPEVLQIRPIPIPDLQTGQVLIRVEASSVNAADVLFRSGKLKLLSGNSFPRGAGFDFTGEVVGVGKGVTNCKIGDAVWGFLKPTRNIKIGATAEYALVPAKGVALRPQGMDAVDAAALPGVGGAALGALRDGAHLKTGEKILIRGGAGGVGTAAIQIAHSLGARITTLVRAEHLDRVRDLGADEAFDYRTTDPSDLGRFDVVMDPVAKNIRAYHKLLSPGGRMVVMTVGGWGEAAYLLASIVFGKRRVRFLSSPPNHEVLSSLTRLVEAKAVVPVVDGVFAMKDIASAHRSFEAGGGFGKRVIKHN